MKVLHVESGRNWGGQEYRTIIEIRWLNAHGHVAWLACDPASESFKKGREMGIPLIPISMKKGHYVSSVFKLWQAARKLGADVIQTHSSFDSWMAYPLFLFGYPVVRSRNITNPISSYSRSLIYRYGCTHVIAAASCIKDELVGNARVGRDRVEVVGEGVDLAAFHPEVDGRKFRLEMGIPDDVLLVGAIAMLRFEKGVTDFVEAAAEVLKRQKGVCFIVVGAGRQRAAIEECIRESLKNAAAQGWIAPGDRPPIILAGYRDDVPHVMAALDVVVIPSHMEARCRVIAEAFAMRRPVIATQVGGIPEIVKHGVNGVLVPAKSPIKLADTIAHLLSDNALRAQLAMAAWVTAKTDLSLDKVMAQTLDLYERLI